MPLLPDLSRFLRRVHPDREGRAEVRARQIYILPTRYGMLFGALLAVMLLGSINSANNLGFMLTFLLAGLGIVAILHTWHNLLGLQLLPGRVEPVFAGQEASFHIQLKNPRQGPRPGIQLELAGKPPVNTDLASQDSGQLVLHQAAPQRGTLPLNRITVSTRYPLGLLRAWTYVELDSRCLVYPKPGPRMRLPEAPDYSSSAQGDRGVGADDFVGLRQYRPSDSPRRIDWKAAARERGLMSKQFGGDRSERTWLDWYALEGLETEERLSRLCRGVLTACEQQLEFGLRLPGEEVPPARGEAHRQHCLALLARFGKGA
jgi:uncharacterized protein (DUF58 family)